MKTPSRYLFPVTPPSASPQEARRRMLSAWLTGAGLLALLLWFIIDSLQRRPLLLAILTLLLGLAMLHGLRYSRRLEQRWRTLAQQRQGESICQFARAFDRHTVDSWVIRAVWNGLSAWINQPGPQGYSLALRATDRLEQDLAIQDEELDELLEDMAAMSGRVLESDAANAFLPLRTVGELVLALNALPMTPQRQRLLAGRPG